MKIHLIAVGGSVMHNLAIALKKKGYEVTGSDDEVYNPAKDRLAAHGLLPEKEGWDERRISGELDAVIVGMHARKNNPELLKAMELGVRVYSFPEYIYEQSKDKIRLVVAGSHGKTTTTSMVMHVLKHAGLEFDYLVGAQLKGFDTMVGLSDAPLIVLEGDEYLSSPLDLRPKILHYQPHVTVITGVAWDHVNVFPTFENYYGQFVKYVTGLNEKSKLFYFEEDVWLNKIIKEEEVKAEVKSYKGFENLIEDGQYYLLYNNNKTPLKIFGQHNLENLRAAYLLCREAGVTDEQFLAAVPSFEGAAKRLQTLYKNKNFTAFLDFAHAPSKARATTNATNKLYPKRDLVAVLELHTYSSLNKNFHEEYQHTLLAAGEAHVFYSEHTLKMKKLPYFEPEELAEKFDHQNLKVWTDSRKLFDYLQTQSWENKTLLLMTSGTFDKLNLQEEIEKLL